MRKERIAIIGTGIAGLTAAHKLHELYDIELFEANNYVGGHTHTKDVKYNGKTYPVNTGFIVYNDRVYKNFNKLISPLGISRQATQMSFSVSDERSGLEYNGHNLNTLFAQRKNLFSPRFHKMVKDILRFNKQATNDLNQATLNDEQSLGDYLKQHNFGQAFCDQYIIPMGSAIWSSDEAAMLDFPALFFIRFFNNHGLLAIKDRPQWYTLTDGSRSYIEPLTSPFADRIHTNSPVRAVHRYNDHVLLQLDHEQKRFDQVIFACHSNQALAMLADPTAQERSILGAIRYSKNSVILHTDERLLPRNRRAWAAWNYHLGSDKSKPPALTYNMNILQNFNDTPVTFCVTLNREEDIDPGKIISGYNYEHPVFNQGTIAAQQRYYEIGNRNRSHFCGAYWFNGFHEDGVNSGLRVAEDLIKNMHDKVTPISSQILTSTA